METMIQSPLCPSCERPMSYQETIKSWRCTACNPAGENVPLCKTQVCKRPLTRLGEPWNCWICLHCNEHPAKVNEKMKRKEKPRSKLLDVKPDENKVSDMIKEALGGIGDTVREIVQDELANWHIQKPPVTKSEIAQLQKQPTATVYVNTDEGTSMATPIKPPKPETWRQKAKRMGIKLHRSKERGGGMRKKIDVLAEMEAMEQKENETVQEELRTEVPSGSGGGE